MFLKAKALRNFPLAIPWGTHSSFCKTWTSSEPWESRLALRIALNWQYISKVYSTSICSIPLLQILQLLPTQTPWGNVSSTVIHIVLSNFLSISSVAQQQSFMPLVFLDRPPYPGLGSASNMTFPCQEGVVLYCIAERFALRKHLPISLGHPPALPRAGHASSSPLRPARVPADTLAKPLSLAAAGASFTAKVREHFPQCVPC